MEKHIPKEYREKLFCDKCKFVSLSRSSLNSHKKYAHNTEGTKFVCHCGKVFIKPGRLNAHKKYSHGNFKRPKKHFCKICNKSFDCQSALQVCNQSY